MRDYIFVERVNLNDIRLAKSRSNLYDGNYQKYLNQLLLLKSQITLLKSMNFIK